MPPEIYKFFNAKGIDLLQNLRLKITPPNAFNDPFELTANATGEMTPEESLQLAGNEDAMRDIYVELGSPGTFEDFRSMWQAGHARIAERLRAVIQKPH